ncbi:MAG: lipid A deacylase LpxR family protein [Gammaproteobacteria bacterium]|nr:lipid A deacylase LpxR family protein [Gammaproteobacteria bacterium]
MRTFLSALSLVLAGAAAAAPATDDELQKAWTVSVAFENDLFGESDAQYTNGIQIGWVSPDLTDYRDSGRLPAWSLPLIEWLPFINDPGLQRNVGFVIGQLTFTPNDTRSIALLPDDRPYAGWLYAGAAFHSRSERRLDTIELQLGIVGPASLAEQAQNLVHDVRGFDRALGWSNQLDNEPGLALIYERKWRAFSQKFVSHLGMDAISHLGATVGNVYTYGNAGVELRLGWKLPSDFGTSQIRPGGETNAPTTTRDPRFSPGGLSAHGFVALTGRVVGRDIFLDGNTFSSSHSVDKKPLVADLLFGAAVTLGPVKLSYAQVFRSEEFDGQHRHHEFGSVSMTYTF